MAPSILLYSLFTIFASSQLATSQVTVTSGQLPLLQLPYGTWQATTYESDIDVYTFKNIRFAAPPLGQLRFAAPAAPLMMTAVQNGSVGNSCLQALRGKSLNNSEGFNLGSEDCLFLDLVVPGKAVRDPTLRLPVVNWLWGGWYLQGGKDNQYPGTPNFNGSAVVANSNNSLIYVAGNYRLGALGWLAGSTMENDTTATPNAGLYDQRAVLMWINKYIGLVGGNSADVTVWGQSSGGGSILHHLTAFGGTQDPLFNKALVMSPALVMNIDRKGLLENYFQNFTAFANCPNQGLACLRNQSTETLRLANAKLNIPAASAQFMMAPAADGKFVRQNPLIELASGNFWKNLSSIIVTNVINEGGAYAQNFTDDTAWNTWMSQILPTYASSSNITAKLNAFYPSPITAVSAAKSFADTIQDTTQLARSQIWTRDNRFTCGARALIKAYSASAYPLIYAAGTGTHGADQNNLFYSAALNNTPTLDPTFAAQYQRYMIQHALTGNPNSNANMSSSAAPMFNKIDPASLEKEDMMVLIADGKSFVMGNDTAAPKSHCDFLEEMTVELTNLGGYAVK